MIKLQSYVCGSWQTGSGASKKLHDPSTEAVLAEVSQGGIDFAAALVHARQTGGPALRALGFCQRAALLKALAGKLHEHRDELIEISTQNGGNTRGDAKFDLDGMTGTLAAYAGIGAELPEDNTLLRRAKPSQAKPSQAKPSRLALLDSSCGGSNRAAAALKVGDAAAALADANAAISCEPGE